MKLAPQPLRRNLRAKPAPPNLWTCAQRASIDSAIGTFRTLSKICRAVTVSRSKFFRYRSSVAKRHASKPFRMNTCKSVSKQRTLTTFRINTYEKPGGGGSPPAHYPLLTAHYSLGLRGKPKKQKAPPYGGAAAMNRNGLLTEVVDQATLDAQVVLLCAAKVGVQIFKLDRTERQVARQLHVRAAAERHGKRVRRHRRDTCCAGRRSFPAEQHLPVRGQAAVRAIRQPRPEQIVDFMSRASRRQAGNSAAADVADKSEPAIHIDRKRAPGTLATGAWRTRTRIDSDVLILSGNFHAPGFLGLSDTAREQSEPKQNEQFTHSSLHKDIPTRGRTITIVSNL